MSIIIDKSLPKAQDDHIGYYPDPAEVLQQPRFTALWTQCFQFLHWEEDYNGFQRHPPVYYHHSLVSKELPY